MASTVVSVVGNRPQFVKQAPLALALAGESIRLVTVDTGQHYDPELQRIFYEELDLAPADHVLRVGSGTHAQTTARVLERLEPVLLQARPEAVVVYGDTDSTLAAALAAVKLGIPVVHVEAGLRSYDRRMPEELNRVLVDAVSTLLACPSEVAAGNLRLEGIVAGVEVVGDVMVDAARIFGPLADRASGIVGALGVEPGEYVLATVHRAANTEPAALARVVEALSALDRPVVLPLHPRTRAALDRDGLAFGGRVLLSPPLGYLEFTALLRGARVVVTDSGGAQKEAYLHGVPCLTLRPETEWTETVDEGWNRLVGTDAGALAGGVARPPRGTAPRSAYGDGFAAERIARLVAALG
jgi:UDP-GlcNAc3NAcA epimerase